METLIKTDVQKIINQLPSIDLSDSLEWDIDEASYKSENYEIEFEEFFIRVDLDIQISGYTIQGDYWTPSEFVETRRTVQVSVKELWVDEELIDNTFLEMDELEKAIKNNINI